MTTTNKKRTTRKSKAKNSPLSQQINSFFNFGKADTIRFTIGLILLVVSVFMLLAFISFFTSYKQDQSAIESMSQQAENMAGLYGAKISDYFINTCFGIASFFIPLFFIFTGLKLMRAYRINLWRKFINYAFLMIWISVAASFFLKNQFDFSIGGSHGDFVTSYLNNKIGVLGTFFVILSTAILYLVYLTQRTIIIIRKIFQPKEYIDSLATKVKGAIHNSDQKDELIESQEDTTNTPYEQEAPIVIDLNDDTTNDKENQEETLSYIPQTNESEDIALNIETGEDNDLSTEDEVGEEFSASVFDPKLDLPNYKYPSLSLLKKYNDDSAIDMKEQQENKNRIITILRNFGVEITGIKATVGPTITLYEITPAPGVRIAKIRNLEDDIALSLSAIGIRIIAPIPGKGTIGIEVPNAKPRIVSMESILNSRKFQESDYDLPIALGKTITNDIYMVDLAKMPHLLVAGATGQGKSVGLNAVISSLLYKKHPAEFKLVLIDPKKVEFSVYAPIENHFLAKVPDDDGESIITDVNRVKQTLKSLCQEMDNRYILLKKARARNIKEYNEKFTNRKLNPNNGHRFLPYIVVIIDEFGDLIMTAGKEIELPIARLAQLARAIGIHLVIATQRPTTNIITGTIKANFPARMAFRVLATIDSRTILDQMGANQLIGRGDMLFLASGKPVERVQCAFIDTPEVERLSEFISNQQGFTNPYELPEVELETNDDFDDDTSEGGVGKLDSLFEDAAKMIVVQQQGSASLIQRKFSIGYNRAGRLMDQLEKAGIVGPAQGSKPRDVLCHDEAELEYKLEKLNLR